MSLRFFMGVAALASALWCTPATAETNLAKAVVETKLEVGNELRDPRSAYYRNVGWRRLPSGHILFCGEVNARNGLGGYAGFARFLAFGDKAMVDLPVTSDDAEIVRQQLFEEGYKHLCLGALLAEIEF